MSINNGYNLDAPLEELAKRHPHRIQSIVTTLKNNKVKLLDVVNELNVLN